MKTINPSTIEILAQLVKEMIASKRLDCAEALTEALSALVRPQNGWLTTGQAAERLGITIPTVKDWIRRGTVKGQLVGNRWWVAEESVEKVLGVRKMLEDREEDGYPTEEEIYEITKQVRRKMVAERHAQVG